MSGERPLLEVEGLRKEFRTGGAFGAGGERVLAVDGVDLAVERGRTLGLVGESGCGKSTLARLILGLYRPTAGAIRFDGADLSSMSRRELQSLRRRVQIVFQDPYASLNPRLRIGAIVAEPLITHRIVGRGPGARGQRRSRVTDLLESVGLRGADQDRYPHELSGGQRQRVGIARALALAPDLIVLDEPVSALDVSIQAQILELLAGLQEERGIAYVFVAHDLSVMRQVADRVAVMYLGRIVEVGDTDTLFDDARHPYTRSLLSAVPIPDPLREQHRRRIVLAGELPSPSNPPAGCSFHTRCPIATERCSRDRPALSAQDSDRHRAACHYPVTDPEILVQAGDARRDPAPSAAGS